MYKASGTEIKRSYKWWILEDLLNACMGTKYRIYIRSLGSTELTRLMGQWNAPARNHCSCLAIVFRRCASTRNIVFRLNFKFFFSLCGFFVAISRHVSPCGASAFAPEALEALGDVSAKLFYPILTLSRALACSTRSTQFHAKTKEFAKGVTKMVFKNFILHLLRKLLCAVWCPILKTLAIKKVFATQFTFSQWFLIFYR